MKKRKDKPASPVRYVYMRAGSCDGKNSRQSISYRGEGLDSNDFPNMEAYEQARDELIKKAIAS